MKKNLLVGIIGLSALALFTTNVNAETIDLENVSETGKSVIVGEVDVPVYSVDITWGDLTYDWKYDDVTKSELIDKTITEIPGGHASAF